MSLIPLAFLLLSSFLFYYRWSKNHQRDWLMRHGEKVAAQITSVQERTDVRINYRTPWEIHAAWQDPRTGQTYSFVSEMIMSDPRLQLMGPTIDVYVDPDKPTRYYMDLTALSHAHSMDPS
jgi:hypothetical protein